MTAVQGSLSDVPIGLIEGSGVDGHENSGQANDDKGIDADADAIGDDEWTHGMDEQPFVDAGRYGDVVEGDLENDMDED